MMTAESMVAAHTLGGLLRDFEGVKVAAGCDRHGVGDRQSQGAGG